MRSRRTSRHLSGAEDLLPATHNSFEMPCGKSRKIIFLGCQLFWGVRFFIENMKPTLMVFVLFYFSKWFLQNLGLQRSHFVICPCSQQPTSYPINCFIAALQLCPDRQMHWNSSSAAPSLPSQWFEIEEDAFLATPRLLSHAIFCLHIMHAEMNLSCDQRP